MSRHEPIHKQLRALLESLGVTQARLAETLGVTPSTVNEWVKGKATISDAHLTAIVAEVAEGNDNEKAQLLAALLAASHEQRLVEALGEISSSDQPSLDQRRDLVSRAFDMLRSSLRGMQSGKVKNRTLCDFPESFMPLVVVEGDKREQSASRVNMADFGALSASPAETRWLSNLGLRDVEALTDKLCVLENLEDLRARFGQRNLLVIGSPGSNHLARRIHLTTPPRGWRAGSPFFRFNASMGVLAEIEKQVESLRPLNQKQLVGKQGDGATEALLKQLLRFLFAGGVYCPTGGMYKVAALELRPNRDFGVISLARNPFSEDDKYVSILVSGFHMIATAHALRMLADSANFADHPLGGVVRVEIQQELPFGKRFDESTAEWDRGSESSYTAAQMRTSLEELAKTGDSLAGFESLDVAHRGAEFKRCLEFLEAL